MESKNPSDPEKALSGNTPDYTCLDLLAESAVKRSGLNSATVDPNRGQVAFEFDPDKVSDSEIWDVARRLEPAMQLAVGRAVFHIEGRNTAQAGEQAIRSLKSKSGVRRAIASYIGETISVTFDPSQTSESSLLEQSRAEGIALQSSEEASEAQEALAALRSGSLTDRLKYWFSGDRLEWMFVIGSFVFMITGLIAEKSGMSAAISVTSFTLSYLFGGYFGASAAWDSLKSKEIDIDLLMVLAALGAAAVGAPFEGAMLLFLFALSNVLQGYAMGRTRRAVEGLARLRPKTARVILQGSQEERAIESVAVGEIIRLLPGEQIPLDAEITKGESTIDQSSVTGESLPVEKGPGDVIYAGTINQHGSIDARVIKPARDSTLARMIAMVEEAQMRKAHTQRFLEETEQRYAIGVIALAAALSLIFPLLVGTSWGDGFYRAITVMVVASPCALVISTPASILSAIANGARNGILFKGGAQLEKAARISAVAFDKTGTLTTGEPKVVDFKAIDATIEPEALLGAAAAVESRSEHPLAKSIVRAAQERDIRLPDVENFNSVPGKGASARYHDTEIRVGSLSWTGISSDKSASDIIAQWQQRGYTVVGVSQFTQDNAMRRVLGVIAIADTIRPETEEVVAGLKTDRIERIAMLTGDHRKVAEAIGEKAGIDEVYADLLPEDKVRIIQSLGQDEEIAMVGDGTNDAPALASAALGIAMGAAGNDIAMESADVVLMSNDLKKMRHLFGLSRHARAIVGQNLLFAGGIIAVMVLATLFLPVIGLEVPLPLGVIAHEGGTVLVCLNGLRLLGYKPKER